MYTSQSKTLCEKYRIVVGVFFFIYHNIIINIMIYTEIIIIGMY